MLKGKAILEDPTALGIATEAAVFKHLFARYYAQNLRFSYWRGKKEKEVDLIAEVNGEIIPFEVKYRAQNTGIRELKGLMELCEQKNISRGFCSAIINVESKLNLKTSSATAYVFSYGPKIA